MATDTSANLLKKRCLLIGRKRHGLENMAVYFLAIAKDEEQKIEHQHEAQQKTGRVLAGAQQQRKYELAGAQQRGLELFGDRAEANSYIGCPPPKLRLEKVLDPRKCRAGVHLSALDAGIERRALADDHRAKEEGRNLNEDEDRHDRQRGGEAAPAWQPPAYPSHQGCEENSKDNGPEYRLPETCENERKRDSRSDRQQEQDGVAVDV